MALKFLVGDIGGTKTELALTSDGIIFERIELFHSKKYDSLEEILNLFLGGIQVFGACFGVAGPVKEGICKATNLPWIIEEQKIKDRFAIEKVLLVNDITACAYGVLNIRNEMLYTLNKGQIDELGNRAIISPGTGLGEALMIYSEKRLIPVASEGGHSDFAPRNENEIELFRYLKEKYGRVSYERILSGNGLSDIYSFLAKGIKKDPDEISREACLSECSIEKQAVKLFCEILGAEGGNLALKGYTTGGIYIGGGIAPKILEILKEGDFLTGFFDKGRFSDLLKQVPISIILDFQINIRGAAFFFLNSSKM